MADIRTALLATAIVLAGASQADCGDRTVDLTFNRGLRMLMENNLAVKSSSLDPRIAYMRAVGAHGPFDPTVFASFKRTDTTTPLSARSSVAAGGLSSIESEGYDFSAGISGRTSIGTEYSLELRDNWTSDTFSGFEYEYESFTGVTVRQPLLKGTRSAQSHALVTALKDYEISEQVFRQAVSGALSEYTAAWWDLMTARRSLQARARSLELAERLLDINRKKLDAGAVSRLELVQVESAAAARREDLLAAEKAMESVQRRLKELIADDAYAMRGDELVPVGEGALKPVAEGLDAAVAAALAARPEYLEQRKNLEKERIRLEYAANQAWPEVDLEASYGLNGLGDSFTRSFSGAEANPQWSVGVVFSYPIGNRAATGEMEAARHLTRRALLRLKRTEQEIVLRLDGAIKEIETDARRLAAAADSVRLAEETLAAEERKLEAGRSTTFNVLKIQEDLLLAELKRLAAESDYNKALAAFYLEKGTLIEELGVRITDLKGAQ